MSKTTDIKQLFQTFTFKNGIEIKNRIAMAPMTTWASNDDYAISNTPLNWYPNSFSILSFKDNNS